MGPVSIECVIARPGPDTCLLTKSKDKGGLDFGTIGSSAILASILVMFILYATLKQYRQAMADAIQDA